jgi:hypothetical protein
LVFPREPIPSLFPHEQPDRAFESDFIQINIQTVSSFTYIVTAVNSFVISLPEIHEELQHLLRKTENEIRALPKPPSSDPFGEVLHLIGNFTRDLSRHLEGISEKNGLLQITRLAQLQFQRAIRATAPEFRPYERKYAESRTFSTPNFLAEQGIETEDLSLQLPEKDDVIFIDEVFKQAQLYV